MILYLKFKSIYNMIFDNVNENLLLNKKKLCLLLKFLLQKSAIKTILNP